MFFYNPNTKECLDRQTLSLKFNTSFPKTIEEYEGWYKLHYGNQPDINEFQYITENEIQFIDGVYIITYSVIDMELDKVKSIKKERLSSTFEESYDSKKLHLMSSLGFEINANSVANTNIEGLLKVIKKTGVDNVLFRDFNNEMHEVSLEDLETMQLEIIMNGQKLYAKKWEIESSIEDAHSIEELLKINDDFNSVI